MRWIMIVASVLVVLWGIIGEILFKRSGYSVILPCILIIAGILSLIFTIIEIRHSRRP